MKPILAAILALILAGLACNVYIAPDVPVSPTPDTGSDTGTPTKTAKPILAATKTPASIETAEVVRAVVNVRQEPGGAVIGYVEAGQTVTILYCGTDNSKDDYNWCEIELSEQTFWIWRGCLTNNPLDLGCQAE